MQSETKTKGGFLGGILSSSPPPYPSLMERQSWPEFGWLAAQVLHLESQMDEEIGLWPSLQQELLAYPGISPDAALKVCLSFLLKKWGYGYFIDH